MSFFSVKVADDAKVSSRVFSSSQLGQSAFSDNSSDSSVLELAFTHFNRGVFFASGTWYRVGP
jgi:hypothetical protein